MKPENLHTTMISDYTGEGDPMTDLKKAMRERERSSPGDREEAKMARSTAGVTGMRLEFGGSISPASGPTPGVALATVCAADAERGYGRCDETGCVGAFAALVVVAAAAAYVAGVMVLVLGVELGGVRVELELDRTEDEGEATIVRRTERS